MLAVRGGYGKLRIVASIVLLFVLMIAALALAFRTNAQTAGKKPGTPGGWGSHAEASESPSNKLGKHYLMLVNTAIASDMNTQKMAQFDRSPYDGLAVAFWHAYDTSPVHSVEDMETQIAGWKKATSKDIWPWVYLNRMIGGNDAEGNPYTKDPYFHRFQGLDFENKAGARQDFLQNWRNSLRTAKHTGAPGIVCDLEFYNNDEAYNPAELARLTGHTLPETLVLLKKLGAEMADIAGEEYPGATLWFLFTTFNRVNWKIIDGQPYFPASKYVAEGLLDEILSRRLSLLVVSGGETGLGYCHDSVADFQQMIDGRAKIYGDALKKYPGILELGGTLTVWNDRSSKRGWMAQGPCGSSPAATVEDLEPQMELLFRTYRCSWIYGSGNGGYLPFEASVAPRFDAAIAAAKLHAFGATAQ